MVENELLAVSKNFKKLRKKMRMTQIEMAELLNVKQSTISNIESGSKNISYEMLDILINHDKDIVDDIVNDYSTVNEPMPSYGSKGNILEMAIKECIEANKILVISNAKLVSILESKLL